MPVFTLSGVGDDETPQYATVDKAAAEKNFLVMVNLNIFDLKNLLNSDENILYNQVKPWYQQNGYDFNQLMLILNA